MDRLLSFADCLTGRPVSWHHTAPPADRRPLPAWQFQDYLGWEEQGDGKLAYGIFVMNGRLKGDMKKALRTVRSTGTPSGGI